MSYRALVHASNFRFAMVVISLAATLAITIYAAISLRTVLAPPTRHVENGTKLSDDEHGTSRTSKIVPAVRAHVLVLLGCLCQIIHLPILIAILVPTASSSSYEFFSRLSIVSFVFSGGAYLLLFVALLYTEERCFSPVSTGLRKNIGRGIYVLFTLVWIVQWATAVALQNSSRPMFNSGGILASQLIFSFTALFAALGLIVLLAIKVFKHKDAAENSTHRSVLVRFASITIPLLLLIGALQAVAIARQIDPFSLPARFSSESWEAEVALSIFSSLLYIADVVPLWAIVWATKKLHTS